MVAGWTIVLTAIVMCVVVGQRGVTTAMSEQKTAVTASWTVFDEQQQCVRTAIAKYLPDGAHVFIRDPNYYDVQRLDELVTDWAIPVASPRSATYVIALVPGTECEGETLFVGSLG
jgi:hypothetical protein